MGKRGLGKQAFEPVPEGQSFEPYVPATESPLEFTVKAVVAGAIFGVMSIAPHAAPNRHPVVIAIPYEQVSKRCRN